MREILFRGKRTDNGEWIFGSLQVFKGYSIFNHDWKNFFAVKSETVGQYTGLTDKNGKKIFEGDIVDGYNACGEHYIKRGVVKWDDFFLEWGIDKSHSMYGDSSVSSYEVIGNIHDNPELLKGENDA